MPPTRARGHYFPEPQGSTKRGLELRIKSKKSTRSLVHVWRPLYLWSASGSEILRRSKRWPNVGSWWVGLIILTVWAQAHVLRQHSRPFRAVDVHGTLPLWVALERFVIHNLIAARPYSPYTHDNSFAGDRYARGKRITVCSAGR